MEMSEDQYNNSVSSEIKDFIQFLSFGDFEIKNNNGEIISKEELDRQIKSYISMGCG